MRWWLMAGLVAALPARVAAAETGTLIDADQMAAYQRERGCSGPALDAIRQDIDFGEKMFAVDQMNPEATPPLKDGQTAASDQNTLAQAAADKGCAKLARDLFLGVIEKFTGDGYAAMRQRAQIGIDDLREAEHSKR